MFYIRYIRTYSYFSFTYSYRRTNFPSIFLFLSLCFVVTRLSIGRYVSTRRQCATNTYIARLTAIYAGDAICATALHTCWQGRDGSQGDTVLSERGSTYISASVRRQSASFPRDSDSGRPCQALVRTDRCTMLRRFPGVIIRDIIARLGVRGIRGRLSIRIFLRAVASLSERCSLVIDPNEVQLRWKGHEPIWEIRL